MATTIRVSYDVPADAFERIQKRVNNFVLRDADFNGADVQLVRDEYTSIESNIDGYDVARLFDAVQAEIAGAGRESDSDHARISNGDPTIPWG
jgi:hypothetical protein